MASIKPHNGKWRASVWKLGVRDTKVFPTKTAASSWAARREFEIENGQFAAPDKTFGELMEEYGKKISPTKKGGSWELKRIEALKQDPIWRVKLDKLNSSHFAEWRDRRLAVVKPSTVSREWNLLSPACNTAKKEWKWLSVNPMSDVKRPGEVPPRTRVFSTMEQEKLIHVMGEDVRTISGRVCLAFQFAIETAMREQEVAAIRPEKVNLDTRVCKVTEGKTHAARREVPLSSKAVRILKKVGCDFNLTASQISSNFRDARKDAGIFDATFHDARHNAVTALAKKYHILDLARIVGHKKIQELMTYYNPSAEELAKQLD